MSARELVALVEQLPDDSAFRRARESAWSLLERLVANGVNIGHGQRADYRSAHGAEYHFEPIRQPELPHLVEEAARREEDSKRRGDVAKTVLERMLTGQLRMTDIDTTRPIEEVIT